MPAGRESTGMFERILVPTDGSEAVADVLEGVLDLAERTDATVHVLNVADTSRLSLTTTEAGVLDLLEEHGAELAETAADRVRERGVDVVTAVRQGEPAPTIVDYAADEECDLVVLPTHGRTGVARLFLGSVTERVVRQSEVPVLAVRPDADLHVPVERVLVPTDGSAPAASALETGVALAIDHDAALHLLDVVDTASLGPDVGSYVDVDRLEARADRVLEDAAAAARDAGREPEATTVEFGTPHREITRYASEHDVDLVVMGTQGRTGLDRYLLGSTTEKVLRTAPVPVLTVHGPDAD